MRGPLNITLLLLCLFLCQALFLHAQDTTPARPYWQQEVHYHISTTLNDQDHSLKGSESIEYINHSPDTLGFLWFHCWPNAYKDKTTALYRQLSQLDDRMVKLDKIKENGYIDQLDFTIDGRKALTRSHPLYSDILRVELPAPLPPGGRITISTPFFVRIPSYFSRLGHDKDSYMITQWYPKPAVYDRKGWHEMPYLDQGEFYSEFGSFDVRITLPSSYVVAATGTLDTREELAEYKAIGRQNRTGKAPLLSYHARTPGAMKTLDFHGENIHDFAWFADKAFFINYDTLRLPSGKVIDVFSYYRPQGNRQWMHSTAFMKDAVLHYSKWIGEYAYPVVSAVEGPGNASSGGMEYPMITLITSPKAGRQELDGVIAHEVGHNWFYGMLGNNEREHPWMDEGINTFYEFRYEAEKYRGNSMMGSFIDPKYRDKSAEEYQAAIYRSLKVVTINEPVETPAAAFPSEFDYGMVVYVKAAEWMFLLEKALGKENFEKGMQAYFSDWKFQHPYPEDLRESLERSTGLSLEKDFDLLNKAGTF